MKTAPVFQKKFTLHVGMSTPSNGEVYLRHKLKRRFYVIAVEICFCTDAKYAFLTSF